MGAAAAAAEGSQGSRYVLLTQCLQNDFFLNRESRLVLSDYVVRSMLLGKRSFDHELGTGSRRRPAAGKLGAGPLGLFLEATIGRRRRDEDGEGVLDVINIRDWHRSDDAYDAERRRYGAHCEGGTWGAGTSRAWRGTSTRRRLGPPRRRTTSSRAGCASTTAASPPLCQPSRGQPAVPLKRADGAHLGSTARRYSARRRAQKRRAVPLRGPLLVAQHDEVARVPHVLDHPFARGRGVVRLDRGEDPRVLLDVVLDPAGLLAEDELGELAREALVQIGQHRAQPLVRGRLVHGLVELRVRARLQSSSSASVSRQARKSSTASWSRSSSLRRISSAASAAASPSSSARTT